MTGLIRIAVTVALVAGAAGCSKDSPTGPSPTGTAPYQAIDLRVGTGAEATAGRTVVVAYTGWLYSNTAAENKGARFDGGLYTFVLSTGNAIQGWHLGIRGMRVGGQRRLVIPPELAYGGQTPDPRTIPPNATLLFDVELQEVR